MGIVSLGPGFRRRFRVVARGGPPGKSVPERSKAGNAPPRLGSNAGSLLALTTTIGGAGDVLSDGTRRSGVVGLMGPGELFRLREEDEDDAAGLDPPRLARVGVDD